MRHDEVCSSIDSISTYLTWKAIPRVKLFEMILLLLYSRHTFLRLFGGFEECGAKGERGFCSYSRGFVLPDNNSFVAG